MHSHAALDVTAFSSSRRNCLICQAGLDSLGAVELRNALAARFGCDLPATATFDHPTLGALADAVMADLDRSAKGSAAVAADPGRSVDPSAAAEAVLGRLTGLLHGILGRAVAPAEPLMEVSLDLKTAQHTQSVPISAASICSHHCDRWSNAWDSETVMPRKSW